MRFALVAFLLGCPGPSQTKPQQATRTTNDGTCEEIAWSCVGMKPGTDESWGCVEGDAAQTAQYQASCTPEKNGRFALNACMRDNIVGGCTVARGSQCTTTWYSAPSTRLTVEADCLELGALFVAP